MNDNIWINKHRFLYEITQKCNNVFYIYIQVNYVWVFISKTICDYLLLKSVVILGGIIIPDKISTHMILQTQIDFKICNTILKRVTSINN